MLYILYGEEDLIKKRADALVSDFGKKSGSSTPSRIDENEFNENNLLNLAQAQDLFGQPAIYFLKNLLGTETERSVFLAVAEELGKSTNLFIVIEKSLTVAFLNKVKKYAEIVESLGEKPKAKKLEFSIFSLADALGSRDKKTLWILLMKALENDLSAEEIIGVLGWQMRAMLAVSRWSSAADSGLSPFVHKKAQTFVKNFSEEELKALSSQLVSIYHDARSANGTPIEIGLERWVLKL